MSFPFLYREILWEREICTRNSLVKYLYWVSEKILVLEWNQLAHCNEAVTQHYDDDRLLWQFITAASLHQSKLTLIQDLITDAQMQPEIHWPLYRYRAKGVICALRRHSSNELLTLQNLWTSGSVWPWLMPWNRYYLRMARRLWSRENQEMSSSLSWR